MIILFDGVCNLCNGFVDFVIRRDRGVFKFASLQSDIAQSMVPKTADETMYLIVDKKIYNKSTAALMILQKLGFPWFLFVFLLIIPKVIRDSIYEWVARHRYTWFGRRETCRLPTPEERARFL